MKALRRLNPYFYQHRWSLLLGVVFITLSNFFIVFPVKYIGGAVSDIEHTLKNYTPENRNQLWTGLLINGGIIVLSSVLSGVFRFLIRQTIIVTSRKIEVDIHI